MTSEGSRASASPGPFTLVLGGGGFPGLGYLTGSLMALQDAGLALDAADLVVGTSAGALVGTFLRSGYPASDILSAVMGAEVLAGAPALERLWDSTPDLLARAIGAGSVVSRILMERPASKPSPFLSRRFPGGLVAARNRGLVDQLPALWPDRDLWLVAYDIVKGRRVVLGRDPETVGYPLPSAVSASAAVPGLLAPVPLGSQLLVDGGVASTTNLDVIRDRPSHLVICIAPMSYDGAGPMRTPSGVVRQRVKRAVERELRRVQQRQPAARVLVLAPDREQLGAHPGVNFLQSRGVLRVQDHARRGTARQLQMKEAGRMLDLARAGGTWPTTP